MLIGVNDMLYYTFEGTFNLPDETTKKQMLEMRDEFDEYINDPECDYISMLSGEFNLAVSFDIKGDILMEFLKKLQRYDMTLTDMTIEGAIPEKWSSMSGWMKEIQDMVSKGQDAVVEAVKACMEVNFPQYDWREDEGIFRMV